MFGVGMPELIILLIVIFIIFSSGKLPEVGSSIGKRLQIFEKNVQNKNIVYGGIPMNSENSETTRYLAGSALKMGGLFRRQVLNYLSQKYKAYGPELGYDLKFVAKLCRHFESLETRYEIAFISLSSILLIIIGIIDTQSYDYEGKIAISIILFLFISWIIRFRRSLVENKWIVNHFQKKTFDPDTISEIFDATLDSEQMSAIDQNENNIIAYNGFNPFIGSGTNIGGWSFALDLSTPKEELGQKLIVKEFELEELYNFLDDSLKTLDFKGLKIKDTLYVNGSDIRDEKWILPQIFTRPIRKSSKDKLKYYLDRSDSRIRFYKWIQVYDWGNELVVSYFLRFAKRGKNLFIELSVFLLTPLKDTYKSIDNIAPTDFRKFIALGIQNVFIIPFTIIFSWFSILFKIYRFFSRIFGIKDRKLRSLRVPSFIMV